MLSFKFRVLVSSVPKISAHHHSVCLAWSRSCTSIFSRRAIIWMRLSLSSASSSRKRPPRHRRSLSSRRLQHLLHFRARLRREPKGRTRSQVGAFLAVFRLSFVSRQQKRRNVTCNRTECPLCTNFIACPSRKEAMREAEGGVEVRAGFTSL